MAKARASNQIKSPYTHWEHLPDARFFLSMEDFEKFCEESIIIDKNGHPRIFKLNEAQKIFADTVLSAIRPMLQKKPMGRVRVLCHKSRQMGITTVCLKLEQFILSKTQNKNALHIMPTEAEANEMIDRKLLPLVQGTNPDLMATMNLSGNHVDFMDLEGQLLDNRLTFASAGVHSGFHGRTLHILVFDEYAKYLDPFGLEAGILPALSGDTVQLVLFTAKGMNHAYDLSEVAQDPESDWIYIFLPWYILKEYERVPEGKYKDLTDLSEYDVFLCKEFEKNGVPIDKWARKLQWYDYTFVNEAKRNKKYMNENYPTVASESFEASGSPIFDSTLLYKWMNTEYKTLDVFYRDGNTVFDYIEGGSIKELEPPIRNHTYFIGIDPADGEVYGDDSAISVWDVTNEHMKQVAAYNGTISQNDLAELAYDIAIRYNQALLVPERNMGQLMIKWLTEVKGYMNIWTDVNKVTDYNNLGVRTTPPSKNEMVARLKFLMNNGYWEAFDPTFCKQGLYFTFQKTATGQFRAAGEGSHHDDSVFANLLITMALDMGRFKEWSDLTNRVSDGRKYN
jgi:hypothetical protein